MSAQIVSEPLLAERLCDGRRRLHRNLVVDLGERLDDLGDVPGVSQSGNSTVIAVPAGFETDYSSIPFFARAFYRFDRVDVAGVVHDYAYRVGAPRKPSDRAWMVVARSGERRVSWLGGWCGYLGLRLGGWVAYRARARERQPRVA